MSATSSTENTTSDALEQFVAQALELRRRADVAERDFMVFLREGEVNEAMWQPVAPTFDRFLKQYGIVDPSRYRNACAALDAFGEDVLDAIGLQAAVRAVQVPPGLRPNVINDMLATAAERGVPLSSQGALRIVSRYAPSESRALGRMTRMRELEEENRVLKAELREAKRELRTLRKKLEKARAA